ncbi:MAG: hypothetical protein KAG06_06555 [Methylococcales bacterium]|nr:hypothetical protein [Methylococcales bacterium]
MIMKLLQQKHVNFHQQMLTADGDTIAQWALKRTGRAESLNQLPSGDVLGIKAMPYYSADTSILELPLLIDTDKEEVKSYVQQLLLIPSETGKITFKVLYRKKLD